MVCINSKYVNEDGTLNALYSTESDGVAVLGFMFQIPRRWPRRWSKVHIFEKVLNLFSQMYNICLLFI